jgi:hypothetical protein
VVGLFVSAAVQARLDLVAVEGGIACFGSRAPTHAIAVLDVVGAEAALASVDDAAQEELLAGRAQFLNAQPAAFQIVVRAEPVDLEAHLRRVRARAQRLPDELAQIALDYAEFLEELTRQRTLLERHCYVVLPDQTPVAPALSLARRLRERLRGGGPTTSARSEDDPQAVSASVARRLLARADLVARQLGRSGLHTRRLNSRELAELVQRCWSPELARVQRLRDELSAYTTLVVGSHRRTHATAARAVGDHDVSPGDASSRDEQLFNLGTRTLADLIAPSGCEIRADHLRLDGHYARVLVLTSYPRLVTPGWLSLLTETDLPIELSLHVQPLASAAMVRTLSVHIARLQSSRLAALRGERVSDPEREIALEDAERLRERLQRGEERLFAVSLYLLLRAKSLTELD